MLPDSWLPLCQPAKEMLEASGIHTWCAIDVPGGLERFLDIGAEGWKLTLPRPGLDERVLSCNIVSKHDHQHGNAHTVHRLVIPTEDVVALVFSSISKPIFEGWTGAGS